MFNGKLIYLAQIYDLIHESREGEQEETILKGGGRSLYF